MPEGHTIHRLAQDLNRSFKGNAVAVTSPQGRFEVGAARLNQTSCSGFEAFGKHLLGHFGTGDVLHVHLGLIGKFTQSEGDPVGQVRMRISVDDDHWDLRGPMVCRVGDPTLADEVAASVGPDPLRRGRRSGERFGELLSRRRVPIGAALLDQAVLAGIGNVYRSELLFLLGVDPRVPANSLTPDQVDALWNLTVEQLKKGKKANRIVTVDHRSLGYRSASAVPDDERLFVYKRQDLACRACATAIQQLELANRKIWLCPTCQVR